MNGRRHNSPLGSSGEMTLEAIRRLNWSCVVGALVSVLATIGVILITSRYTSPEWVDRLTTLLFLIPWSFLMIWDWKKKVGKSEGLLRRICTSRLQRMVALLVLKAAIPYAFISCNQVGLAYILDVTLNAVPGAFFAYGLTKQRLIKELGASYQSS